MSLQVFKQKTYEGCLPICLLSLGGIEINREKELELIRNGVSKPRDGYYAFNMLLAFIEQYNSDVNLYVDIKPYSNYLNRLNNNKRLSISHQFINKDFLSKQSRPFVLYVDWYDFEGYTHAPHFIVIEKQQGASMTIIDPWAGKRIEIEKEKILNSILNLKKRFFFSPLLITLKTTKEACE